MILYEMATGLRPFTGDTQMSILSSIMRDSPKPVTEAKRSLPRDYSRIVMRCLSKDVEDRYQTAKDVRNDLRALKNDLTSGEIVPVSASGETPAPMPIKSVSRGFLVGVGRGGAGGLGRGVIRAAIACRRATNGDIETVRSDDADAADHDGRGGTGLHLRRRPLRGARLHEERPTEPVAAADRDDQQRGDRAAGRRAIRRA